MPGNRVEDLEQTVDELRSTVEGVTEELVEAKERIRVLEAELDTDAPTRVPDRRESEETPTDEFVGDSFENEEEDEEETQDSGSSDIIIA